MSEPQPGGLPAPDDPQRSTGVDRSEAARAANWDSSVFLESADPPFAAPPAEAPPATVRRPPGPGLWESIAWMIGVHVVQFVAGVAAAIVLVGAFLATTGADALQKSLNSQAGLTTLTRSVGVFFSENLIVLIAASQLATVVFGLAAIRLRLGPRGFSRMGWHLPAAGHWLLVLLLVPPLLLLSSELQQQMFRFFPKAHTDMQEFMNSMLEASLPILVLVIGAGPALGEELIFRGLIGRGLIARWGFLAGILITSVLFGVMHINPGQAIGVIPLGMAMHLAYLATRSFWAPVTVHLANNSLSVVLLKFQGDVPIEKVVESGAAPIYLHIVAAAMLIAVGILLWQTRVRYVLPDGSLWNPGYASSELPPPESGAIPVRQNARLLFLAGGAINSLGFLAIVWKLTAAS